MNTGSNIQNALKDTRNGIPSRGLTWRTEILGATSKFRRSRKSSKVCLQSVFSKDEGETLIKWILENKKCGFLRRKVDVEKSIRDLMEQNWRSIFFKSLCKILGQYFSSLEHNLHVRIIHKWNSVDSAIVTELDDFRKWFSKNTSTPSWTYYVPCFLYCNMKFEVWLFLGFRTKNNNNRTLPGSLHC